jgi:tetratricopeptide (TPR) repeat protein
MSRFHWKNFAFALGLVVIVLAATLLFFPEWSKSNGLFLTIVGVIVVTVVGFVANWRTAFEQPPPVAPPTPVVEKIIREIEVPASTLAFSFLHQLQPPPRDFTGREAELTELLTNFDKGVTISGLHGQGGIGKTALALKLAEQLTPRYPDAQFFLDLKGVSPQPLTTAEALAHVIRAYHPLAKLPEGEAELRGLYLSVLHDQRALLLMDNAKDAAQVELLLPPATCCLLVTSRQHFTLPGLPSKNLEQLPPDDARELLVKIAPRITPSLTPSPPPPPSGKPPMGEGVLPSPVGELTDGGRAGDGGKAADVLAKLCGYLPLALRLTASALAERVDLSPADLIRRLTDTQKRLELTGAEASLRLSYDLLPRELQKLWRALAVFPDSFDRAAAVAVWKLEADKAHDVLSELVRLSMIDFSLHSLLDRSPHPGPLPSGERESPPSPSGRGDGGEGEHQGRYRLHDLARLYAASLLNTSERDAAHASRHHATHYATVLRAAKELYKQGGEAIQRGLALFDLEQKNIQAGQAWAEANLGKDDTAAQLCDDYPDAGTYILDLRQHPHERIRWLESALAAARRLKRREAEGVHLGNLGLAYSNLGETRKAIDFYEQALVISRKINDRRNEGAWLGNLGIAYADLGETRKAIEYHEQALVIDRQIGDRRGEGQDLGNLGNAYADLGETHKAIEYYEQQLIITREIGDRRGEGNALGSLGLAYADLGGTRKAIEYYEQALPIFREIGDRRGEGNALQGLGISCYSLGETRKAIEYYEQQLVITREIGDRRGEGNALFNMSLALNKLGERAQAIAHAQAALKIREEIEDPRAGMVRKQLEAWGADGVESLKH